MNNTLALKTYTSYNVLRDLKVVIQESWKLKEVIMEYNTRELPDYDDIKTYPCTLRFKDGNGENIDVKIFPVTLGYGGAGPTAFEELLKYFEIPYDEESIFTKKEMDPDGWIRLWYMK